MCLEQHCSVTVFDGKLGFDGLMRRGRCIGHIVNLAANVTAGAIAPLP
jgi:hypothetical protein